MGATAAILVVITGAGSLTRSARKIVSYVARLGGDSCAFGDT